MTLPTVGLPTRLSLESFLCNRYVEIADPGVALEDVMSFGYWAHVHPQLRIHDLIEIIAADGSFEADLRVIRKGPGFLQFRLIREWRPEIVEAKAGRFEAVWSGPAQRWCVRSVDSGEKIMTGLDKAAALSECTRLESAPEAA